MQTNTEQQWLDAFVSNGDEAAFERLVGQHIDLVLGSARRMTRDHGVAEEVTQNVFAILARKASRLKAGDGLAGWLHKTTLYESKKALRGRSRQERKMRAFAKHAEIEDGPTNSENRILPLVDEAIDELPAGDRQLILLHFLEGHSFAEISRTRGKSEGACQKQASRAIAKLRAILNRRGVATSVTAITSLLAAESAKAAPAGLVSAISGGAITGAATITTPTLITNAIQTMTYAKTKVAILVAATAAIPIGVQMNTNAELKEEIQTHRQREIEYVAQAERLAELEKIVASSAPAQIDSANATGSAERTRSALAQNRRRPLPSAIGSKSGAPSDRPKSRTGAGGGEPDELGLGELGLTAAQSLQELMKNPAMRHLILEQIGIQTEAKYGELLDHLDLGDELRDKVSTALRDQIVAFGIGDDTTDASGAMEQIAEHEQVLRELLGDERYKVFELFEDSEAERQELAGFRNSLEEQGHELPFEIEQQLMAIMFEEKNVPPDLLATEASLPEDSTTASEELEELLGDAEDLLNGRVSPALAAMAAAHEQDTQTRVRARVAELLTPEQLAIFEANQESHLRMYFGALSEHEEQEQSGAER